MKKLLLIIGIVGIAIAAVGAHASITSAANLNYARILDTAGNTVLVRYNGIGNEFYYACSISPLNCGKVATTTSLTHDRSAATSTEMTRGLSQAVSPDLRYLASFHASTPSNPQRTFTIYDTNADKMYQKTSAIGYWDLLSEGLTTFSFSPDSKKLVYLDDVNGHQSLYSVDLTKLPKLTNKATTTFASTQLTLKPYDVTDFIYWDANTIYFTANRDNPYDWALYKYSVSAQTVVKIADNVSYNDTMKRNGQYILFIQIHKNSVDPMIYDTVSGTVQQLPITPPNTPFPKTGTDSIVTFANSTGVLMKPVTPAAGNPLLIWLHGGPFREASMGYHSYFSYGGYDWILEQLRNSGVTVLKLDYPGSFGFGRAYSESLKGKVGLTDVQAVLNAAATMQSKLGSKSVGLVGNSYGGYLALRTIVEKPASFMGAFSINGVTDWQALHERIPSSIFTLHFAGPESLSNLNLYNQASIFNLIHNLTTQKIVLTHGNADTDIPEWQSQLMADQLKSIGKNVSFTVYDGEDHIYAKPDTFTDLCKRMFAFENVQPGSACDVK